MSKPLSRAESMRFWSDRDLKAGEWEPQIEAAMYGAVAAVLLVSDNFLASDYVIQKELPYLCRAHEKQNLMIFWFYLEPCDIKQHPEIMRFQGTTLGKLEPMSKMNSWEWKQIMLRGCEMINEFLKDLERPSINPAVVGKTFPMIAEIELLAKPARRKVEVLVYSADEKWWRQSGVNAGMSTTKIQLGNESTRKGTTYKIVAMTTERPLTQKVYFNLPDHRTKSAEITLVRC